MSRLIIENLPKNITKEKFRSVFEEKGEITDVQLKYTKDGKFRHFGFIGYRTPEQAQTAIDYFHNTCINANRISVKLCANLGDSNKPKAWSKYAPDSTAYKQKNEKHDENFKEKETKNTEFNNKKDAKKKEILQKMQSDPEFKEFMELHLKSGKNIWSNDIDFSKFEQDFKKSENTETESKEVDNVNESESESDDLISDSEQKDKIANKDISDLEYMKSLMTKKSSENEMELPPSKPRQRMEKKVKQPIKLFDVKVWGLPIDCKKKDVKHFFDPIKPKTVRLPRKMKGIAYVGFRTEKEVNKALIKDRTFLSGKRISVRKHTSNKNEVENNNINTKLLPNDMKKKKWVTQEESLKNEEDIAESGRIYFRNLAYCTTEEDIQKLFEKYGLITEVNLPIDKDSRQIKGFGTIVFLMPEHAAKAYSELDGTVFNGRILHLLPAKAKKDDVDTENLNYKEKKELTQKKQAGSSHNWNTLFLGHNAVAEAVASTYGTSKARVLGAEADQLANSKNTSAAVRLALGETQLVQNVKSFLEDSGVCLDAFNQPAKQRSKTIILAKNLPAETTSSEIVKVFQPFGMLGRVILPPSGITALIEFSDPSEARQAFTKLAYSKFKYLPLYLEWAPENSFKTPFTTTSEKSNDVSKESKTEEKQIKTNNESISDSSKTENSNNIQEEEEEEEPEPDTTLFVKNLNFSTTEENLRKHFETCGKLCYATVATKKDPKNPGNTLSMGYGFIRYLHKESAEKALITLQLSLLDGKTLELKRSERTLQSDVVKTAKKSSEIKSQTGTKILVRNVPFQASKTEIQDLFKTFGEIKALRLPKKMAIGADTHRGFAFIDYYTKSDAKRAFKALCQSTHLYGRRLVLEWATNEAEDVTELRKRTAQQLVPSQEPKRSRKGVVDMETLEEAEK